MYTKQSLVFLEMIAMPSKIHIHNVMLSIMREIGSQRLNRADLVAGAMSFRDYKSRDKAQKFIARQAHRLSKLALLTGHGPRNGRWYLATEELFELMIDSKEAVPSVYQELSHEEVKLESTISLHLAEMEEMNLLLQKYPTLSSKVDAQVHAEKNQLTRLYGKLSAIRKLKVAAESLEVTQC